MNRLGRERRAQIIAALCEGNYNLCRIHKTLRVTPGVAAGPTDHVWSIEETIRIVEAS